MLEGIITPIVTPFHNNTTQSINYEATTQLVEFLINRHVSGLFILGSNGEFHVLSAAEKIQFAQHVIKVVAKRVPVYVGTGCCSTQETINLSREMEKLGANALSVVTPYFINPNEDELYEHFISVAQSVSLPIILYNIPKFSGYILKPATVERLADVSNIVAIKDSSGDLDLLTAYAEIARNKEFKLLVGSDSKISIGYQLGAVGAVAGTSNVITTTLVALFSALKSGDTSRAQQLQHDIEIFRDMLPLGTMPSIMKQAIELADIAPVGPARRPVMQPNTEAKQKIMSVLDYFCEKEGWYK